eukprot:g2239.t1
MLQQLRFLFFLPLLRGVVFGFLTKEKLLDDGCFCDNDALNSSENCSGFRYEDVCRQFSGKCHWSCPPRPRLKTCTCAKKLMRAHQCDSIHDESDCKRAPMCSWNCVDHEENQEISQPSSLLTTVSSKKLLLPLLMDQNETDIDNTPCGRLEATAASLIDQFYLQTSGQLLGTNWWISGVAIEGLANTVMTTSNTTLITDLEGKILNTFDRTNDMTVYGPDNPGPVDKTLSGYFDDELWWGLAWARAYQAMGNKAFLERAQLIFMDVATRAWDTQLCGGGVLWNLQFKAYKNSITNSLFLTLAARLAVLTPKDSKEQAFYMEWAGKEWNWLSRSGLINDQNLLNDGLNSATCKNNGETEWTYNQGVILGGISDLWKILSTEEPKTMKENDDTILSDDVTFDKTNLLLQAKATANAAISKLTYKSGVLKESCDPIFPSESLFSNQHEESVPSPNSTCDADQLAFKGIFTRYLGYFIELCENDPNAFTLVGGKETVEKWKNFLSQNANSIWNESACYEIQQGKRFKVGEIVLRAPPLLGSVWIGPCGLGPQGASQVSAVDLMHAAACASGKCTKKSEN